MRARRPSLLLLLLLLLRPLLLLRQRGAIGLGRLVPAAPAPHVQVQLRAWGGRCVPSVCAGVFVGEGWAGQAAAACPAVRRRAAPARANKIQEESTRCAAPAA